MADWLDFLAWFMWALVGVAALSSGLLEEGAYRWGWFGFWILALVLTRCLIWALA